VLLLADRHARSLCQHVLALRQAEDRLAKARRADRREALHVVDVDAGRRRLRRRRRLLQLLPATAPLLLQRRLWLPALHRRL
jgi:hypothetical protein